MPSGSGCFESKESRRSDSQQKHENRDGTLGHWLLLGIPMSFVTPKGMTGLCAASQARLCPITESEETWIIEVILWSGRT